MALLAKTFGCLAGRRRRGHASLGDLVASETGTAATDRARIGEKPGTASTGNIPQVISQCVYH